MMKKKKNSLKKAVNSTVFHFPTTITAMSTSASASASGSGSGSGPKRRRSPTPIIVEDVPPPAPAAMCPVCLSPPETVVALPCGHTLCAPCATSLLSSTARPRCPVCRSFKDLKPLVVDPLPTCTKCGKLVPSLLRLGRCACRFCTDCAATAWTATGLRCPQCGKTTKSAIRRLFS